MATAGLFGDSDGQAWGDSMRLWLEVTVVALGLLLAWSVWRLRQPQVQHSERRVRHAQAQVN